MFSPAGRRVAIIPQHSPLLKLPQKGCLKYSVGYVGRVKPTKTTKEPPRGRTCGNPSCLGFDNRRYFLLIYAYLIYGVHTALNKI